MWGYKIINMVCGFVQELRIVYNGTFNSTIGFYGRIIFRRPQMLPPIFGRWLGATPQGFTLQYQPLIESDRIPGSFLVCAYCCFIGDFFCIVLYMILCWLPYIYIYTYLCGYYGITYNIRISFWLNHVKFKVWMRSALFKR